LICCISRSERLDFSCCARSRRRAIACSLRAMFDYIISGIVAVVLLLYLGYAMFKPEKF